MTFSGLAWLFALAVTLHNLEEGVWLPGWSKSAGRWHAAVGAGEFRFAVIVLTLFAYICVGLAVAGSRLGAYLVSGYALAMALNVVMPHLLATIVMRRYAPGTATAVLFNLPIALLLLRAAFVEGRVSLAVFAWAGPLTVIAIVASIPGLFALGRWSRPDAARAGP